VKALTHGVERAGSDVAVDDTERRERKLPRRGTRPRDVWRFFQWLNFLTPTELADGLGRKGNRNLMFVHQPFKETSTLCRKFYLFFMRF
jgi:hypothetical protein